MQQTPHRGDVDRPCYSELLASIERARARRWRRRAAAALVLLGALCASLALLLAY